MRELLDAWGNPIRFLRWAPGFFSPMQPPPNSDSVASDPWTTSDPFDPLEVMPVNPSFNTYGRSFALFPLVFSAGADGRPGVIVTAPNSDNLISYANTSITWPAPVSQNVPFPNNPFLHPAEEYPSVSLPPMGTITADGASVDNISNHFAN